MKIAAVNCSVFPPFSQLIYFRLIFFSFNIQKFFLYIQRKNHNFLELHCKAVLHYNVLNYKNSQNLYFHLAEEFSRVYIATISCFILLYKNRINPYIIYGFTIQNLYFWQKKPKSIIFFCRRYEERKTKHTFL